MSKFKIDEDGRLHIERAGDWVQQECPFNAYQSEGTAYCTHACPHFGTPFSVTLGPTPHQGWQLNLCHGTELTGKMIDERGSK